MELLLPDPMIHGAMVWLRAMEHRDLEAFARNRNDINIGRMAGYYYPESSIGLEKWFEGLMKEHHGKDGYYFTICRLESDDAVGFAWLWHIDHINSKAEFSIFLADTGLMDQGLGTDALNAVLRFAFNNLPLERVYLTVRHDNKRAIRSYEKAGFVLEGKLRNDERFDGQFVDNLMMSILREEWAILQ